MINPVEGKDDEFIISRKDQFSDRHFFADEEIAKDSQECNDEYLRDTYQH